MGDEIDYTVDRILVCQQNGGQVLDLTPPPDYGIRSIPKQVYDILKLKKLNLSGLDCSSSLTKALGKLVKLEKLVIAETAGTFPRSIPTYFWNLTALTELDLSANRIKTIPNGIGKLSSLETLDLAHNSLSALPLDLCSLASLKTLILRNNAIEVLPKEIGKLTALETLDMNGNNLRVIPMDIGLIRGMRTLDVGENKLDRLPTSVGLLNKLISLIARQNRLTEVPAELGKLVALQELDLFGNALTSLPPTLGRLKVARANFAGNAFKHEPLPRLAADHRKTIGYLRKHLPDVSPSSGLERRKVDILLTAALSGKLGTNDLAKLNDWLAKSPKESVLNDHIVAARLALTRAVYIEPLAYALPSKKVIGAVDKAPLAGGVSSEALVMDAVTGPVYSGPLYKQGANVKSWKRRTFVLHGPYLYYFKSKNDTASTGAINLATATQVAAVEDSGKHPKPDFLLHTASRTYVLQAENNASRSAWIAALEHHIALVKSGLELPPSGGSSAGGSSRGGSSRRAGSSRRRAPPRAPSVPLGASAKSGGSGRDRPDSTRMPFNEDKSKAQLMDALATTTICTVCHSEVRQVVLMPCAHFTHCSGCWAKVTNPNKCPSCSEPVENAVTVKTS